jgi:hypothetical protein
MIRETHPDFLVTKAPDRSQFSKLNDTVNIFLAGSIDMGEAADWQSIVADRLKTRHVSVFNPRRDNFDPSMVQDISNPAFSEQVEWELDHLEHSDFAMFYFDPLGKAPITLMELGIAGTSMDGPTIYVACPPGYWRRGNVQVFCKRHRIKLVDSLDEMIKLVEKHLDRWEVDDTATW